MLKPFYFNLCRLASVEILPRPSAGNGDVSVVVSLISNFKPFVIFVSDKKFN